jgi:MarR family transcriptional regulator, organic hydroperoxide resistance regulator
MTGQSRREQLNAEILESVSELIGRVISHGEQLAQKLAIPAPFIKALHTMDCPMAMKDLGKRMHCDPSFVTLVADMLEKRGLARREPHPADRRVKNIVLTDDGRSLKHRLETEIASRMPWSRTLTDDERAQLLALIRKMLSADGQAEDAAETTESGDVASAAVVLAAAGINPLSALEGVLTTGAADAARDSAAAHSPGRAGGGDSAVSEAPAAS